MSSTTGHRPPQPARHHPVRLPRELQEAIGSPFATVRGAAVQELARLVATRTAGLVLAASVAREQLAEDDSRTVAAAAEALGQPEAPPAAAIVAPAVTGAEAEPRIPNVTGPNAVIEPVVPPPAASAAAPAPSAGPATPARRLPPCAGLLLIVAVALGLAGLFPAYQVISSVSYNLASLDYPRWYVILDMVADRLSDPYRFGGGYWPELASSLAEVSAARVAVAAIARPPYRWASSPRPAGSAMPRPRRPIAACSHPC